MPNYSNGKIYTIRCRNDPSLIYVGSTIQPLYKRWGQHKIYSFKYPHLLIYNTINNEWDNWYIELYELYPCSCKEELCKREGQVIREIGNLNVRIEGRTKKEYYNDNKDIIKEKDKLFYEMNKDKILEHKKQYHLDNKEIILERKKEYYNKNKDIISEKRKQYYNDNKDKILEQKKNERRIYS